VEICTNIEVFKCRFCTNIEILKVEFCTNSKIFGDYFSERMNFVNNAFCSLDRSFKILSLFEGSFGFWFSDWLKKYSGETFRYSHMYRNISKEGFLFPFSIRFM